MFSNRWLSIIALAVLLIPANIASGASLTYSSSISVYLTTPAVTFTIVTSSVAESLVVNAGNIVATISTSTIGNLTLTSTSTDFSISTGASGVVSQSCGSGNVASTTLALVSGASVSATFTITPTANHCVISSPTSSVNISSGTSSSRGGRGSSSLTSAVLSFQSQIAALLQQIIYLRARVAEKNSITGTSTIGHANYDAQFLQIFLNTHGFPVAISGPGSPGYETQIFGTLTRQALIKFQEAHANEILVPLGFTKGTGILGARTKAVIDRILSSQ